MDRLAEAEMRNEETFVMQNAVIQSADISNEDHGLLSIWISLDYGGMTQGFGGYALYLPKSFKHHDGTPNVCGHFIWRVMECAGVSHWNDLIGKTVRAKCSMNHVEAIGHIVKDIWFYPKDEFEKMARSWGKRQQIFSEGSQVSFIGLANTKSRTLSPKQRNFLKKWDTETSKWQRALGRNVGHDPQEVPQGAR